MHDGYHGDILCFSSDSTVWQGEGHQDKAGPGTPASTRARPSERSRDQPGSQRQVPQEIHQTQEVRAEGFVCE